jgi:hypothetical protein
VGRKASRHASTSTQEVALFFLDNEDGAEERTPFGHSRFRSAPPHLWSCKPAVSATTTGSPPISSDISKISCVVPGMWVMIAASPWAALSFAGACNGGLLTGKDFVPRKFRRLLLPTFGGPKIRRRISAQDLTPPIVRQH